MPSFAEYMEQKEKKKKKKQSDEYVSFSEYMDAKSGETDIAPVKSTKTKSNKRTWFDTSVFDDGFQWADIPKVILGTDVDVTKNLTEGIVGMGEKIADAGLTLGAIMNRKSTIEMAQSELIFNTLTGKETDGVFEKYQSLQAEVEKGTADFVAKDLYDEEKVAQKIIERSPQYKAINKMGAEDEDDFSVLGEKSDALVQSGGQLLATAGLQAVGVPWWLTTGATTFGAEAESAFNEGATFDEAVLSSTISAGAEILTEKISGGINFGGATLDDALTKELARGISNKVVRTLAKLGIDAVGEGSEEILSGVMSAIGQKLSYADDKEMSELFSSEEAFESFIGGAVLGGGMGGINAIKSSKNGVDYASGLTNEEKAVVDKVYEDTITEAEADGKKLTQREKSKIYDSVLSDMEKGYISTDTIEEVLGGETYKSYKDAFDNEEALQNEFNELNKMKQGEMTGEQLDRRNELKEQLADLKENSNKDNLKSQLYDEVFGLAKDSKLAESYNEKTRRSQAFEADLTQYEEKYQGTIKKAVESGILNNTRRTHEMVDFVAKISADKGVLFDFADNEKIKNSSYAVDGKTVNGFVDENGNVVLNINSAKSLNSTAGHEITHILEGTELYDTLSQTITEYAKSKGDYQSRIEALNKLYENVYKGEDFADKVNKELVADLVGDYIFTDKDFVRKLSTENRNIFEKIYDEIKYLCKVATAGSKEARELEKVKKTFAEVYRDNGGFADGKEGASTVAIAFNSNQIKSVANNKPTASPDIRYSLSEDSQGRELSKEQQNYFKDSKIVDENGNLKVMYHGTPETFTIFDKKKAKSFGTYGNGFYFSDSNSHAGTYGETLSVYLNITNPLKNGTNDITKEQLRKFVEAIAEDEDYGIENYGYGATIDSVTDSIYGKTDFAMILDINISCVGNMVEAVELFNKVNGTTYNGIVAPTETVAFYPNQIKNIENTTPTSNPDIRYSLSEATDTEYMSAVEKGDTETAQRMVDEIARENGYRIKGHHGTDVRFTIFDRKKTSTSNDFGQGFYFSSSEFEAEQYQKDDAFGDTYNKIDGIAYDNALERIRDMGEDANDDALFTKIYNEEFDKELKRRTDEGAVINAYLKMENPFVVSPSKWITEEEAVEIAKNTMYADDVPDDIAISDWIHSIKAYAKQHDGKVDTHHFANNMGHAINLTNALLHQGKYDGILDYSIRTKFGSTSDYHAIALYSNKIKDSSPVTYDDNGNVIPLSQRFNADNNDIRYSISKQGEAPKKHGNFNIYGKDVMLENKATTSKMETVEEDIAPVYDAPITEDEANAIASESLETLTDTDAPPEIETEYYEMPDTASLDNKTLKNIGKSLRETLTLNPQETKAIQEIVQEYSTTEFPSKEELFDTIKEQFGEKIWKVRNDEVADVKRWLRTTKVKVSQNIKGDIAEYSQFRRSNQGKIAFSKEGMAVDSVYQELTEMFPSFFPADITTPSDQLLRMSEVANLDIYSSESYQLDDETIQEAVDIISAEVNDYKEDLNRTSAEETAKEELDDIAPAKVQQIVEGMSAEAKLVNSLDNYPIKTVKDRALAKLQAVESELADNKQLRREAEADYKKEIERLTQEYVAKKDKNTQVANNIVRRILRLEKLKANVDADYAKRISDLEAKIEKMNSATYQTAVQRKSKMQEYTEQMENLVGDTSTWVDKKMGISYKVNTLHRNLRDIVRDENGNRDIAKADAIYEELQGKYNHNEAELNRESAKIKKVYADMKLTKAENTYVQMLGEFRHNPDTTLTEEVVKEFYEKHKRKIDTEKVDKAINLARQTYDGLLERVNNVLREQGMKEIPYRQGYFPHFNEDKQSFLAKLFNWKTQNNEIPTDIAGLTENFNPERSWQSFNKERKGDTTDYNFEKGLDTYVQGALDWIYHIEDIQKRRAFENHIRYIHSDKGVQERIEAIKNNEEYDADEAQAQIDLVYKEAGNPLNNFVTDFRTATNTLAGKKSSLDRTTEEYTNRKIYSVMTNIQNRMSANMIAGSVSSALTNFIPITQSWGQVSPVSSLRAMGETIISTVRNDGKVEKSDFLTNRLKKSENLYKTTWDKVIDKAGILMECVDNFTSQVVWRSKYNENISKGMSESEAIKNADQFAENVLAGRSRGNQPTIFDAKNPLVKAFTLFQLEVNNQYGYMFKDVPQDLKTETKHWKANLVKGYATMFLGAYAYNALYSSLVGRDSAFDPISIVEDLLRDLGLFDDEEEEEPANTVLNLADNILEEVPFIGSILGGGRIPISSTLPYDGIYEMFTGTVEDIGNKDWANLTSEWLNPLTYLLLPAGGGQIKKTMQGLSMFDTNEDHPIAGSYTVKGGLRFPVDDTLANRIQSGIFGQWSNKNARDYIENGRKPLNEKQTQEFIDVDLPIADYWKYRDGLKGLKTNAEKADYINSLDIKDWQKNLLMNNILDRKENVDMADYGNYGSWEEFDFAEKNPEKYEFFQNNGISYSDYANADEDGKRAYTWAYENPSKYALSKAVTSDLLEYNKYKSDLYDIKADKDEYGETITGTGKEKKAEYIFGLDLDYGQQIILYRSLYSSKEDKANYNRDIVEYLDSREDISWEEMKAILEELDFTVYDDGTIKW